MAFGGLLALIDDITTIADDVSSLTYLAAKKTTGLVTDDMAVTAEQTLGLQREREIPVVLAVAKGSLFNKFIILAPGALLLNFIAPFTITPILMLGGTYLCFEGVEKVLHTFFPHEEHHEESHSAPISLADLEAQRVSGAIRTDLILSAEIVAITLGEVATAPLIQQVAVIYGVSLIITVGVYGLVMVLVKLDDAGEALVLRGGSMKLPGQALVSGTPYLMRLISWVGTVAMLLVGGHILVHGVPPLEHAMHDLAHHAPEGLQGLTGQLLDFGVGALAGLIVVAVMKTGIPGKLWAMRPWAKAA